LTLDFAPVQDCHREMPGFMPEAELIREMVSLHASRYYNASDLWRLTSK